MLRVLWSVPAIALCVVLSASTARAQSQSLSAMQPVTGSGYGFQVPDTWQLQQLASTQRRGSQLVSDDGSAISADGSLQAHLETASGFGITKDQLPNVLAALLGIGMGGDISGSAPIAALAGPDSVQVGSADSALSGAAVYTDPSGSPRVMAARIALRGDTAYTLILDVTEDFYQTDPGFAAIMNSFQLTAP